MEILKRIWRGWKKVGELLGEIVGRAFLMIFYLTITLPFGLGTRLFSDPLAIKDQNKPPHWITRNSGETTIESAYRQF